MSQWTFEQYVTEEGDTPIADWYQNQGGEVRAAFDAVIGTLEQTEDWEEVESKLWKELTKAHSGLCEVTFYVDHVLPGARKPTRRRFRAVGIKDDEAKKFILMTCCEKVGMNINPAEAFNDAKRFKAELAEGRGLTRDHI